MRPILIPVLMLALQVTPAFGETFNARDFFRHRSAAADAVRQNDLVSAQSEIAAARSLLPSAPSVLLMSAQIDLAAGKPETAKVWLRDYIRRGLWFDPARHTGLAALLTPDEQVALSENGKGIGGFTTLARIEDLRLAESVAVIRDQVYYTTIHDGALNRIGKAAPIHALPDKLGGYGIAAERNVIWMAVSPDQAASATAASPAEIVRIDTASPSPPKIFIGAAGSRFGDIAVGAQGVYVSDTGTGQILRLEPEVGAWQPLVPAGRLPSPQGMAESADGKMLIVADYTSGLYVVDLANGGISHLPVPETTSLVGIDGVTRWGEDVIAVQNGLQPPRILRIRLKYGWKSIEYVSVILQGGELDEPTNGTTAGNRYIFVARSQWSDFESEGIAKATHGPAIIGEIKLAD
jgi:hypothetical protein